ncbi:21776_t:CDS:2 [Gigaspora rosea]|nr:21776_t:CDS:2 [Gigaspora rosea]
MNIQGIPVKKQNFKPVAYADDLLIEVGWILKKGSIATNNQKNKEFFKKTQEKKSLIQREDLGS